MMEAELRDLQRVIFYKGWAFSNCLTIWLLETLKAVCTCSSLSLALAILCFHSSSPVDGDSQQSLKLVALNSPQEQTSHLVSGAEANQLAS